MATQQEKKIRHDIMEKTIPGFKTGEKVVKRVYDSAKAVKTKLNNAAERMMFNTKSR